MTQITKMTLPEIEAEIEGMGWYLLSHDAPPAAGPRVLIGIHRLPHSIDAEKYFLADDELEAASDALEWARKEQADEA